MNFACINVEEVSCFVVAGLPSCSRFSFPSRAYPESSPGRVWRISRAPGANPATRATEQNSTVITTEAFFRSDDPTAPWMQDQKLGGMTPRSRRMSWLASEKRRQEDEDWVGQHVARATATSAAQSQDQKELIEPLRTITPAAWRDRNGPNAVPAVP